MSVLTDLIERVRSIIFRRRDERELAEELAFHTAMETEKLERRGFTGSYDAADRLYLFLVLAERQIADQLRRNGERRRKT